jgi:hypothetical protein
VALICDILGLRRLMYRQIVQDLCGQPLDNGAVAIATVTNKETQYAQ